MQESHNYSTSMIYSQPPGWIGRFAPSPTGDLHFGSLVAAVASFMICKSRDGKWLVRIEDIDPPREVEGSAKSILQSLESFGLYWDDEVAYQSLQKKRYFQRIQELTELGIVYRCNCSRKLIENRNKGVYDGFCRTNIETIQSVGCANDCALRVIFPDGFERFNDGILGECVFDGPEDKQDFIIKRRDQLFAYQLAVVADDIEQGVNHVVRGMDILDSTPRQNYLYHCFSAKLPDYYHIPLALDSQGQKLSKLVGSEKIESHHASKLLLKALQHLGQDIDSQMSAASPIEIIDYYTKNWKSLAFIDGNWQSKYENKI